MSEAKEVLVPAEELKQQRLYMQLVRHNFEAEGATPLALTEVYGCQQNEADMEHIRGMLVQMGYGFTDDVEKADLIVINTCAVREGAEDRIYGNVGALKHVKERNPSLLIAVCGCMPQQPHVAEKLKRSFRHVDIVFGTHALYRFPQLLKQALEKKKRVFDIEGPDGKIAEGLPSLRQSSRIAWVTIMYGCNNFCSYCIVPYTRGRERSRRYTDVLDEIKALADKGYVEVTLLGQNVNSYDGGVDFAELIRQVNKIDGIKRIRFTTSHPKDISDRLIDAMAECDNVCEHLHLPFQSGSNRVLRLMNRGYTKERYLEIVDKLKTKIPGISLTSDVIAGFPGETDEDFEHTLDIIRTVRFDGIFSFIYSKRKGTPAEKMPETMTREQIQRNFDRMLELQNAISLEINKGYIGAKQEILVEGKSKANPEMLTGRTRTNKLVHFRGGEELIGRFVNVEITGAQTWYLTGKQL